MYGGVNKYMGLPERSETMELLHLKFTRQSNFPEIPIEDSLGDAIVVLTDATSDYFNPCCLQNAT